MEASAKAARDSTDEKKAWLPGLVRLAGETGTTSLGSSAREAHKDAAHPHCRLLT